MADAPAGFHEAGSEWIERWCEDHPGDVAELGCMSCLGESHDAWMHRAKAAEGERDRLRIVADENETRMQELEAALKRIADAMDDPTLTEEELANVVWDLVQGVTKTDAPQGAETTCPECSGDGRAEGYPCPACYGTGAIEVSLKGKDADV